MDLKDKHLRFAQEYLVDSNAAKAAIRAGYSPDAAKQKGYELMQNPNIRMYIENAQKELGEKAEVDALWVLKQFREIADRCMQATPVFKDGIPTGEYQFDSAGANRAMENIAKHLGFYMADNASKPPTNVIIPINADQVQLLIDRL